MPQDKDREVKTGIFGNPAQETTRHRDPSEAIYGGFEYGSDYKGPAKYTYDPATRVYHPELKRRPRKSARD